ncbi:MAG TPA: multidrug effflux MFS transporter [Chryseolinea sp.]|nr:multidrug effflux MFS transporter [Chryseolinea sp.]
MKEKRLIIWILGALATVTPFAIDLYLPAFSQIANDFGTTASTVSLSVSSYFIGMAIGQILYGPLLDRFGRKPPLYIGLVVFVLASIGCMQSENVNVMIGLRFLQALGGSAAWVGAVAMVRDFFPVEESAKVFSLLFLIIGLSPLLAPTLGGFIVTLWGWQAVFIALAAIAVFVALLVLFLLPEAQRPDQSVSLKPKPIILTFISVVRNPQFATYTFSGAFAFATLFIYVAGSPVIFMEMYHVSPQGYGAIFALLSVGFIGGSQLNIWLNKSYSSARIFQVALICQVIASFVFLICVFFGWLGLYGTVGMFFVCLTCVGLINPNANALALAPFERNIGSASALLGCTQIGVAALASSGVGIFNSGDIVPVVALLTTTTSVSFVILLIGLRSLDKELLTAKSNVGPPTH